jgi:hypothetical protein
MFDFYTLESAPANVHTLPTGAYFVSGESWKISVTGYRGILVVHQYDPTGDDESEIITCEWHGAEMDFNAIEDAYRFIDDELDIDYGFDPKMEWGTLGR